MTLEQLEKLQRLDRVLNSAGIKADALFQRLSGVVHDDLTEVANHVACLIWQVQTELREVQGAMVAAQVQQASESTNNILNATLAGIELAERRKP